MRKSGKVRENSPQKQTWAEAGVSRSRSLLNFRSRSLDSFQVRSRSLGYEAKAEARQFVEKRMRIWASWIRIRIQVPRIRIQMKPIPPLFSWIRSRIWIQPKKLWIWIWIKKIGCKVKPSVNHEAEASENHEAEARLSKIWEAEALTPKKPASWSRSRLRPMSAQKVRESQGILSGHVSGNPGIKMPMAEWYPIWLLGYCMSWHSAPSVGSVHLPNSYTLIIAFQIPWQIPVGPT